MAVDYMQAASELETLFAQAETAFQSTQPPTVTVEIQTAADTLFASATKSYREALLGAGLARIVDPSINAPQYERTTEEPTDADQLTGTALIARELGAQVIREFER